MSDTLWGVLIGSGITAVSPLLTFILNWLKEHITSEASRRAEESRQQSVIAAKQAREHEIILKNALSSVANAMQFFPKFNPNTRQNDPPSPEWTAAIKLPHKWVSLLWIRTGDKTLLQHYQNFSAYPEDGVENLFICISTLAKGRLEHNSTPSTTDGFYVQLQTTPDFRRKKLVDGMLLSTCVNRQFTLADLTVSQREKLGVLLFTSNTEISMTLEKPLCLMLPEWSPQKKSLVASSVKWYATVDPDSAPIKDIFTAWEIAYDTKEKNCKTQTPNIAAESHTENVTAKPD